MSRLKLLTNGQKLTKPPIVALYAKLGYPLPSITRKQELIDSLDEIMQNRIKYDGKHSVLSLDMGLKNMSFTRLSVNKTGTLPTIQQWFKMDLDPMNCQFNPTNYSQITTDFLYDHIINEKYISRGEKISVILERQRYRTAGSSTVLESTLKTNTIESMLCMGLTIHNRVNKNLIEKGKKGENIEFDVFASPPGMMVKYWQNTHNLSAAVEKITEKESKLFRIELVLNMLHGILRSKKLLPKNMKDDNLSGKFFNKVDIKPRFQLSEAITNNLHDNLKDSKWSKKWDTAWSFRGQSRRLWEVAKMINDINDSKYQISKDAWGVNKGDDLADSLLHGIAYCEYLKNRDSFQKVIESEGNILGFLQ